MAQIFITYFPILILYLFLLYALGFFSLKAFKIHIEKPYTKHFTNLMVGLNIFILTTAIYFTKGITVMVFMIPLFFYFIFKYKNSSTVQVDKKNMTNFRYDFVLFLVAISIGSLLFFIFRFGQIYNSEFDIPFLPHSDLVFYTNCIDFLTRFGYENSSCDYANPLGVNPYHYYELWQSAGFSSLLGLNTCLTLILITFSIANILIWIGIIAILEQFKKVEILDLILCFFLVFITGFVFNIYTNVYFMSDILVYSLNAVTILKFYPNYIFLIAAVLFILNKKNNDALICLLALPIVHIGNAISIYPVFIIWYFIDFMYTKKVKINYLMICLSSVILIFAFYKILHPSNSHVSTHFSDIFLKINEVLYWKTAINIIGGSTIQFALIFMPFWVLYIFNFKFQHIFVKENFIIFLIYSISLLGWALLNYKLTSTQIFANISLNVFNLISILIIILIWVKKKRTVFRIFFIAIFLIAGFINSYRNYQFSYDKSGDYLTSIKQESKNFSSIGAFMMDKEDYTFSFSYVTTLNILGKYLIYFDKKTFPLSLSIYDYPYSKDSRLNQIEKETIATSSFYRFVESQKLNKQFDSIEKSQLQFIQKFKINYLICTKNVTLSNLLQQRIKKSIIDKNTGERFYLLK